jgi:hypothetical protein
MIILGVNFQQSVAAYLVCPNASSPTILAKDTFTDVNGTELGAHTMDVGTGWYASAIGGGFATLVIESNQATTPGTRGDEQLTVLTHNTYTVKCDVTPGTSGGDAGIDLCDNNGLGAEGIDAECLRFDCSPSDSAFELWYVGDGGSTQNMVASSTTVVPVGGTTYHMKAVVTLGGANTLNITCSVNGTSLFNYAYTPSGTDNISFMTNVGIESGQCDGDSNGNTFDNFLVTHP